MADNTMTTSSESNRVGLTELRSALINSCPQSEERLEMMTTKGFMKMNELPSAVTLKIPENGTEQNRPIQANLNKLIKNKLKRKKIQSPASTNSNSNSSINQIETNDNNFSHEIRKKKLKTDNQLLDKKETNNNLNKEEINITTSTSTSKEIHNQNDQDNSSKEDALQTIDQNQDNNSNRVVSSKPPLPPSMRLEKSKSSPGRVKRKHDDITNTNQVKKLNAQAEQLRLEVTELKAALNNERNAVRALRAQNEAEVRKSKTEIKKLQTALEISKKTMAINAASSFLTSNGGNGNGGGGSFNNSTKRQAGKDDATKENYGNNENGKLTQEIMALKEANRLLEEKIQICTEAERRKTSDIRELKSSYENRLTQISKSAKIEIGRLLEEIKSKERNIGQLKKEIQSLKTIMNRREAKAAQHSPEMRKLKDIERTGNSHSSNQKCITTTCGETGFKPVPHELNERILETHNDLLFRAKDPTGSDTDSALSSAPQSISPQPPSNGVETSDIWQSMKNYAKELEEMQKINEQVQNENSELKKELDSAKQQIIDLEKTVLEANNRSNKTQQYLERIKYLEQHEGHLIKETHELREQNELLEFRIIELEESHEKVDYMSVNKEELLPMGNWSLRSNSIPDTRDVWTDTEKESEDLAVYADRTDSGITSPHSHNHIDNSHNHYHNQHQQHHHHHNHHTNQQLQQQNNNQYHHSFDESNFISPCCDFSLLEQITNDELKRRIAVMAKKPNLEEDDRLCLLQVLTLINNLETMLTNDPLFTPEEISNLDLAKLKASDYSLDSPLSRSLLTDSIALSLQKSKSTLSTSPNNISSNSATTQNRIVATILPYNSCNTVSAFSTPTDSPRKLRSWNSSSLQESGVFEGDPSDSLYSQSTQTDPEDFPSLEETSGELNIQTSENNNIINSNNAVESSILKSAADDLCAEIQKLNKFRQKVEECVIKQSIPDLQHQQQQQKHKHQKLISQQQQFKENNSVYIKDIITSSNLSELRRLEYYKDRLNLLEKKLSIYESSGDLQIKRLAERLQREVLLESLVKELRQQVETLEVENHKLEEEKCEFEEAENDTRLRLQRLEVDLEILSQRNVELEVSKDALQLKLKEAKEQCAKFIELRENHKQQLKKIYLEKEDLDKKLELIKLCIPTLVLFGTLQFYQTLYNQENIKNNCENSSDNDNLNQDEEEYIANTTSTSEMNKENWNRSNHAMEIKKMKQKDETTLISLPDNMSSCKCYGPAIETRLSQLVSREKELTNSISELNRAYHETMENADALWAQIEQEYKNKLEKAEKKEESLLKKITQLEVRLDTEASTFQERINQLEEEEECLRVKMTRMCKEHREVVEEHEHLLAEYQTLQRQIANSNCIENMNRFKKERERIKALEDEVENLLQSINEENECHKQEMRNLKNQMLSMKRNLENAEVSNSELKEEILTLERQIRELNKQNEINEEKILHLSEELRIKEEEITVLQNKFSSVNDSDHLSLCQEMEQKLKPFGEDQKSQLMEFHTTISHLIETICKTTKNHMNEITAGEILSASQNVKRIAEQMLIDTSAKNEEALRAIETELTKELILFDNHESTENKNVKCAVYYPISRNRN